MTDPRAHEYEAAPPPEQPLAEVPLLLTPTPQTVLEVFLEPHRDADQPGRVLRVNDRRSGLPVLSLHLDMDLFGRLLGGQPVERAAWLLPRPHRDFLGRDRVPLTVRVLPDKPRSLQEKDPIHEWIDRCCRRLEKLGLVDYTLRSGIDVGTPQETFALVCTFLLYPPPDVEVTTVQRRELRAELAATAAGMGVALAPSESDEGHVHCDALVRREDDWWVVEINGGALATQAEKPDQVEHLARDAVSAMLDVPYEKVSVAVTFTGDDADRAAWEAGLDARAARPVPPG